MSEKLIGGIYSALLDSWERWVRQKEGSGKAGAIVAEQMRSLIYSVRKQDEALTRLVEAADAYLMAEDEAQGVFDHQEMNRRYHRQVAACNDLNDAIKFARAVQAAR